MLWKPRPDPLRAFRLFTRFCRWLYRPYLASPASGPAHRRFSYDIDARRLTRLHGGVADAHRDDPCHGTPSSEIANVGPMRLGCLEYLRFPGRFPQPPTGWHARPQAAGRLRTETRPTCPQLRFHCASQLLTVLPCSERQPDVLPPVRSSTTERSAWTHAWRCSCRTGSPMTCLPAVPHSSGSIGALACECASVRECVEPPSHRRHTASVSLRRRSRNWGRDSIRNRVAETQEPLPGRDGRVPRYRGRQPSQSSFTSDSDSSSIVEREGARRYGKAPANRSSAEDRRWAPEFPRPS